jgi:hypothetical protein
VSRVARGDGRITPHDPYDSEHPLEEIMVRSLASLCLAGALVLSTTGCTAKPDQPAAPPDAAAGAAQPGGDIRARADAGRAKADETRANADRMRDGAGAGSAGAASAAPAAEPQVTATATPAAAPAAAPAGTAAAPGGAAQPTYGALPGGDIREGGATARSRADTLRSRADRARNAAGTGEPAGAAAPPPPPAASRTAPPTAAAPAPPAAPAPNAAAAPAPRPAASAAPAPAVARPVDPNELAALLPSMGAPWSRSKVDANTMSSPVTFSQARVTYRQGGGYVRIEIVDSAGNQAALAQLQATLPAASKAGKDGYARRSTFAGYPSWEAWRGSDQHGTLNVLVANRFLVSYTGHGIESFQLLSDVAQRTDLRRLETLK